MTAKLAGTVEDRKEIASIQFLRALAASTVVLHHVCYVFVVDGARTSFLSQCGVCEVGSAGVDIFFVISGFIIIFTMKETSGAYAAIEFLQKRLLRIYPVYWFWTTFALVIALGGIGFSSLNLTPGFALSSYFLIPYEKLPGNTHPLIDPGWTLTYEMYFYLIATVSMFLPCLRSRVAFILITLMVFQSLAILTSRALGTQESFLSSSLVYEFVFGMLIAISIRSSVRIPRGVGWAMMAVGAIGFVISMHPFAEPLPRLLKWGVPAFFLVFGAAVTSGPADTRLARGLVWLGAASYTMYLTHAFGTLLIGKALREGLSLEGINADLLIILSTLVLVGGTSLLYPLVEKPLSRFCRRLAYRRTGPGALTPLTGASANGG